MEIRAVKFRVGAGWRVGALYSPRAAAPVPAVLMYHGFPGLQQNEDIAAELCRRGFTVFQPHFRGSWGSGGQYSIVGLFEDARAARRLLSRYHHVDPERIALLGYSVGGWLALRIASESPVAAVAVMAPVSPRESDSGDADYLRRNAKVLNIPRIEEVWREYVDAARADHPDEYVNRISPTPLLFVQGLKDRLAPPASTAKLYRLAREPKELLELPEEDHEFQNDRPAVVAQVCGWLESRLIVPAHSEAGGPR